jgi:putative tryptophan/tyrosine transport system substrate-binding protein
MWYRAVGCIVTLLLSLLVAPLAAVVAQPREKVPRVGYLNPGSAADPARLHRFEAFRQGLRALGYVDGQTIALESRWAEGSYERYPALVADLIRVPVDVIVTVGGAATKAVHQAARTIPIVMSVVIDPVGSGLVPNLAHPGGNVTGLSIMASDLVGKQLEVLKEVVPNVSRVALLWNPDNPGSVPQVRAAEVAARAFGVQLHLLEARGPQEIDSAFAAMTSERVGALVVLADAILGLNQRSQIVALAAERRLPAVYGIREYAEAGGLIVYSADFLDLERRAATFVDKILKGAKPSDLPVEQPTKFELALNLKTAQVLGITFPPMLLFQADEVIK